MFWWALFAQLTPPILLALNHCDEIVSMTVPSIAPLEPTSPFTSEIARRQFDHWGPLTGYPSLITYRSFLEQAARSVALPRVLVAATSKTLLGSVNLLVSEMTIRPHLTPWLAQLFVMQSARGAGIGTVLVEAAARYVEKLGYHHLFLFTSGRLPDYYSARGWVAIEEVIYLGKVRTVMRLALGSPHPVA
jgi:GNAT superfamily N-acetyltransferase